jgi:hypothetical protein
MLSSSTTSTRSPEFEDQAAVVQLLVEEKENHTQEGARRNAKDNNVDRTTSIY